MSKIPETAMVLAAGMGSRMRPLTDTTPKPLLKVSGKSLMDRTLDQLAAVGVRRLIVNVHWLADKVEAHMRERTDFDIVFSDERGERLETGGALAKARPLLGDDSVWVINTDAFWEPATPEPLIQMAARWKPSDMDALLLVARRDRALGFGGAGDFYLEDDGRLEFRGERDSAPFAYTGVRIIKPSLYDSAPIEAFSAVNIWKPLAAEGRLHGALLDAFWLHVGDPNALADAEMWVKCHGG